MEDDGSSEDPAQPNKASVSRSGWYWLGGLFLIVVASRLLGMLNESTTLLPDRVDGINMALTISLLVAGLSIVVGLNETRGPDWTKFTCGVLAFGSTGFLAPFLLLVEVSDLVFAKIDFPLENTRTFRALLPIGRAYESGRTRISPTTYIIQPTPLWSNIDISRQDWRFMQARRKQDDDPNADDITSDGYFCARVRMQQSGNALRVLDSGNYALPEGSVELCPPQVAGLPYLEVE